MTKELLIIFTKNPELGKVKTRLAKSIGKSKALEIYKFLLNHTQKVTKDLPFDKVVYYSNNVNNHDIWDRNFYRKELQIGEDLGIRMQHSFINSFEKNYSKVVIIGSDLYDLKKSIILDAFDRLDKNDVVIGPAEDGGYYLLGMKTLHPYIFKNKDWGTSTVRTDTLKDLEKVSVYLLEELNDIDVIEDIENHSVFAQFLK